MRLSEIMKQLEEFCPASFAQDWDNVGLQAGRADKEVKKVLIALDCTSEIVDEAVRCGSVFDAHEFRCHGHGR